MIYLLIHLKMKTSMLTMFIMWILLLFPDSNPHPGGDGVCDGGVFAVESCVCW